MKLKLTAEQVQAIDRLLELLPIFEDPDFVPAVWPDRSYVGKDGVRVNAMPYPDFHEAVEEFRNLYPQLKGNIHPYEPLPEDPSPDGVPFNVLGASWPVEWFVTATIDQIRRYMALLGRGERFCDGHIDGEFLAGKVVAALRRLRELKREGEGLP